MGGLVLVESGMLGCLDALRVSWLPSLLIGLYSGDVDVNRTLPLSRIQPAAFSGYSGLHQLPGWSVAALLGDVAVSYATPRYWAHDGGPAQCWVSGYYVVDSSGSILVWAQNFAESILMAELNNSVEVTPAFAVGSRY